MSTDSDNHPRAGDNVLRLHDASRSGQVEVTFSPGPTVLVKPGESLLRIAEANQVPIESGCRMGMCGADPVRIVEGEENLSAPRRPERATLERLGLPPGCRMACVTRVQGPVTVAPAVDSSTGQTQPAAPAEPIAPALPVNRDLRRVVVVGTGVAGITAAEELRKRHPDVAITLLGAEPYDFYNRMAISKLISESTSIGNLYLMSGDWAERRSVRYIRGVAARSIDRAERRVITDEGEPMPYDRLVLATGARPWIPPIEGFGTAGSFVLRTIDDGVQIQQHIRGRRCRSAVVVGGGLLGLEAASSLSQMGLRVFVLHRGPWPLNRQLDGPAGILLQQLLDDLGIEVLPATGTRRLLGAERVEGVELLDGRRLEADLCLVAAGIQPDAALARSAGLTVDRGVVVDDRMMTSDPNIFAAGDVIDHGGRAHGLWTSGVEQARVAIANMLGEEARYSAASPSVKLKVAGIDLLSVGRIAAEDPEELELASHDPSSRQYRKLVLDGGKLRGAILIGYPELSEPVSESVEANLDMTDALPALRRGDWSVFRHLDRPREGLSLLAG